MKYLFSEGPNVFRIFSIPFQPVNELTEQEQIDLAIQKSLEDASAARNEDDDDEGGDLSTFESSEEEMDTIPSKPEKPPSTSATATAAVNGKSPPPPQTQSTEEVEDYRKYLGPEDGRNSELLIRFPDGQREQISFPAESQLQVMPYFEISSQLASSSKL